jgi:hypothetical protein
MTSLPQTLTPPRAPRVRLFRRRGRVLAVKWGYNPNSSSLGVDVTFLLFGLSIITLLTPLLGLFLRFAAQRRQGSGGTAD